MATATVNLKPGELVLAFRIRNCFPARLRDMMLPTEDSDLIVMVTSDIGSTNLTNRQAHRWLSDKLCTVRGNEDAAQEAQLMAYRINNAFAELVANDN